MKSHIITSEFAISGGKIQRLSMRAHINKFLKHLYKNMAIIVLKENLNDFKVIYTPFVCL